MSLVEIVHEYNRQTKEALQTVYDALNNGQRKKLLKNDSVRELFERFKIEVNENA